MARQPKPLKVTIDDGRPPWIKVGVVAALGLAFGITWPSLAGIRIGPHVPGAKNAEVESEEPLEAPVTSALPALAGSAPVVDPNEEPAPSAKEQTVVVGGGEIERCFKGKTALKPEECGRVGADKVLVPRLKELKRCPSAVGLAGEMSIGFDIDFERKTIQLVIGKDGEIPMTTVQGITTCTADYIRDVSAEKIAHNFSRYRVFYSLKFYPPGAAPPAEGTHAADAEGGEADADRGLASVTWDTALIRSEPTTGKVVARLVRGTRVKILGRRKDWYHVSVRNKEGWVYRGALGL